MIADVTLGADTPRSHDIPWQDAARYRASLLHTDHLRTLALAGIKPTSGSPRGAFHPCSICGKRNCPSVTLGVCGRTVDAPTGRGGYASLKVDSPPDVWLGERPTVCQNPGCYGVPLRESFWDGILPDGNGRTHGLFCDYCALTRGHGPGASKYFRAPRARVWKRVDP